MKYRVRVYETWVIDVVVEADEEEEAERIVMDGETEAEPEFSHFNHCDIEPEE